MRLKILSIVALLVGVVMLGYAFLPGQDIKITSQSYITINGVKKISGKTVRINKANGDAIETQTFINPDTGEEEGTHTYYYIGGKGAFRDVPDKGEMLYQGERPAGYKPSMDEKAWRSSKNYAGESVVAGYRVLGQRDGTFTFWRAPDLKGALLKVECTDGCANTEATSVELGQFGEIKFPERRINYDQYKAKVEKVRAVNPEAAEHLEQFLPK